MSCHMIWEVNCHLIPADHRSGTGSARARTVEILLDLGVSTRLCIDNRFAYFVVQERLMPEHMSGAHMRAAVTNYIIICMGSCHSCCTSSLHTSLSTEVQHHLETPMAHTVSHRVRMLRKKASTMGS